MYKNFRLLRGRVFVLFVSLIFSACLAGQLLPEKTSNNSLNNVSKIFLVSTDTQQEAFDRLLWYLGQMPWYKKNGYNAMLPAHPVFKDLGEHPEKIKDIDKEAYFKIFVSEVYKPIDMSPEQQRLTENSVIFLTALNRFNALNKQWGFKVFSQYIVRFATYCLGGAYDPDFGVILRGVGVRLISKSLQEVLIHEMVHIGIEENIVQKFHLSHGEKEGLVDWFCELYFKDLLPDYHVWPEGDARIRAFVTYEDICNDLPGAVERYILKYPRDLK